MHRAMDGGEQGGGHVGLNLQPPSSSHPSSSHNRSGSWKELDTSPCIDPSLNSSRSLSPGPPTLQQEQGGGAGGGEGVLGGREGHRQGRTSRMCWMLQGGMGQQCGPAPRLCMGLVGGAGQGPLRRTGELLWQTSPRWRCF